MGSRILPAAADELRSAIRENGGNELFAIGEMDGTSICSVTITCRGQSDRVTALLDRPTTGQVVLHNHPSGDLTPSDADMELAGFYGQNGVGVVIVDNAVLNANWVVEPHDPKVVTIDEEAVRAVFEERLPTALPGFEPRAEQVEMALAVTRCLNNGQPLVCEAGTGTGKSLAYLIPAALWSIANDSKVVISTFTRTLQGQLMDADVPTLARAGIDVRVQLLQGRNNYLCRRRLAAARADTADEDATTAVLDAVSTWSATTTDGSRMDLPIDVDSELWGRIRSDADYTLRARCPHFATCHYYDNTRRAAGAHIVIVNHALLLSDLSLRNEIGRGVLPAYSRLVLDEGHHLEDAATGVASARFSADGVRQALAPLVDRGRRRGALGRIARDHLTTNSPLRDDDQTRLEKLLPGLDTAARQALASTEDALGSLSPLLDSPQTPLRITRTVETTEDWRTWIEPTLRNLSGELERTAEQLEDLLALFENCSVPTDKMEPLLQVRRARQRLVSLGDRVRSFLVADDAHARWLETSRSRASAGMVALVRSPIDVDEVLQRILWSPLRGVVATSATMTVSGSFQHFRRRTGLHHADELVLDSPFDHFRQALLGLPRDVPEPNHPDFLARTADVIIRAATLSRGGAFVLCTSYDAVRSYAAALRTAGLGPVLAQGEGERTTMVQRFLANRSSILVGTDSFWEGVSVRGDALRLVILPRLPFRVPTDPLVQARTEALQSAGLDPFRVYTLPETVLKLRQGYGRLIRAKSDRGVVLLLDSRVHTRGYGRVILAALPNARRVKGPSAWVLRELDGFLGQNNGS